MKETISYQNMENITYWISNLLFPSDGIPI